MVGNANINGIPFLKRLGIPNAIRNSMILWYDLKRQGATNESMQANPELVDHSGNGHDAVCGNFAWSGMSGIGGYNYDFSSWMIDGISSEGVIMTKTQDKLIYESFGTRTRGNIAYKYLGIVTTVPKLEVMLNNMQGLKIVADVSYILVEGNNVVRVLRFEMNEGYNEIPETNIDVDISTIENVLVRFELQHSSDTNLTVPFTIEQFPIYPGAIVLDGVDDKITVSRFKLGKDYTLLFDVTWMNNVKASAGLVKSAAFFIYNSVTEEEDKLRCFINRGSRGVIVPNTIIGVSSQLDFIDKDFSIIEDTEEQIDTTGNTSIMMIGYNGTKFTTMALRKLLLFDRALSLDEIKWVKNNLMGGIISDVDRTGIGVLKTDGSWISYADAPDSLDSSEVVGITYKDSDCSFCLGLTDKQCYFCNGTTVINPDDIVYDSLANKALLDYKGKSNTELLKPQLTTNNNWAVNVCTDTIFPNGKTGYLMSLGEFSKLFDTNVAAKVNDLLLRCGGTEISSTYNYWTSTLNNINEDTGYIERVWIAHLPSYRDGGVVQGHYYVRPVCEF